MIFSMLFLKDMKLNQPLSQLTKSELLTKCWIFTTIKIRIKKEF
jgi:hypothetical protein